MPPRQCLAPTFYLYGEPSRHIDPDFLHLEAIEERSGPVGGHIKTHSHAELNHIFLFEAGHGEIIADDMKLHFSGPHLLFMPSGVVHGFRFEPTVTGYVLTLAGPYLRDILHNRVGLRDRSMTVDLLSVSGRGALNGLRQWMLRLKKELSWQAPCQKAAIEANLMGLLVELYRLSLHGRRDDVLAPHLTLMANFHALIEAHYRQAMPLPKYLDRLKATEAQLRYACERAGAGAPVQIIQKRRLMEARRLLIYSDMTISECCMSLGFEDPAYFSRVFSKATGLSPRTYRLAHRQG